jgi:hypothetical protein
VGDRTLSVRVSCEHEGSESRSRSVPVGVTIEVGLSSGEAPDFSVQSQGEFCGTIRPDGQEDVP